jgi:hypothetical protein
LKKERDMKWAAFFLLFLTLATGCVLEDKQVIPEDGGVEAGMCGLCPLEMPICSADLQCVECTRESEDLCMGSSPVCDPMDFLCVGCLGDSDCTTANTGKCDPETKECGPCDSGAQCNDVSGLPGENNACRADGVCVECTPETETETCPDGDSCNPVTNECSGIPEGDRETCELCVSDRDCGEAGNRCVPMTYDGPRYPNEESGFCLKSIDLGGSCTNPYRIVITRKSLSGAEADDYCGINEDLSTCPAVRALLADDPCDPANGDQDCPQPAGLCRELPGLLNGCTYLCGDVVECKSPPAPGSTCGSSGSGGDPYCGG